MSGFTETLATAWNSEDTCFNDEQLPGVGSFAALITKYGYCENDGEPLDVCGDMFILMCLAATQVAIGSLQILSALIGRIGRKKQVSPSAVESSDNEKSDDGFNGGMSILGILSWISGVITIVVYCKLDDETNGDSETLYNSFRVAVIMNLVLFGLALLTVVTVLAIGVFRILFRKQRIRTIFTLLFGLIITGMAAGFYGASGLIGLQYVTGDCYDAIQEYSPSLSTVTINIDSLNIARADRVEDDIEAILSSGKMVSSGVQCIDDDDCLVAKEVCGKARLCIAATLIADDSECAKNRDCDSDKICTLESPTKTDLLPKKVCEEKKKEEGKCIDRFDCNGETCVANKCVPFESTLAFPKTFYDVKCSKATTSDTFTCTVNYALSAPVTKTTEAPETTEAATTLEPGTPQETTTAPQEITTAPQIITTKAPEPGNPELAEEGITTPEVTTTPKVTTKPETTTGQKATTKAGVTNEPEVTELPIKTTTKEPISEEEKLYITSEVNARFMPVNLDAVSLKHLKRDDLYNIQASDVV